MREKEFLAGYKTYIIGLMAIITGLALISQGFQIDGTNLIIIGLGFMGLKSAIKKLE